MIMKTAATILSGVSLAFVLRAGLVLALVGIGMLKFTRHEAEAVRPLAENSPFFSWAFPLLSTRMFSAITGATEICLGLLIALRQVSPALSAFGSVGAATVFFIILTFMASSPALIDRGLKIPFVPFSAVQFLFLHLAFLGASAWTAYESFAAGKFNQP